MKVRLDDIDWRILAELQQDARITNIELSRRVGISPPPCLRRVRALEEAGIVAGYRALLDPRALGYDVDAFVFVGLASQSERDLAAFEAEVGGWPLVRECYILSGEVDFLLKCVATDLEDFSVLRHRRAHPRRKCRERAHGLDHPQNQGRRRRAHFVSEKCRSSAIA